MYLEGFSYAKKDCQPTMLDGLRSLAPPADVDRVREYIRQPSACNMVLLKLMDVSVSS